MPTGSSTSAATSRPAPTVSTGSAPGQVAARPRNTAGLAPAAALVDSEDLAELVLDPPDLRNRQGSPVDRHGLHGADVRRVLLDRRGDLDPLPEAEDSLARDERAHPFLAQQELHEELRRVGALAALEDRHRHAEKDHAFLGPGHPEVQGRVLLDPLVDAPRELPELDRELARHHLLEGLLGAEEDGRLGDLHVPRDEVLPQRPLHARPGRGEGERLAHVSNLRLVPKGRIQHVLPALDLDAGEPRALAVPHGHEGVGRGGDPVRRVDLDACPFRGRLVKLPLRGGIGQEVTFLCRRLDEGGGHHPPQADGVLPRLDLLLDGGDHLARAPQRMGEREAVGQPVLLAERALEQGLGLRLVEGVDVVDLALLLGGLDQPGQVGRSRPSGGRPGDGRRDEGGAGQPLPSGSAPGVHRDDPLFVLKLLFRPYATILPAAAISSLTASRPGKTRPAFRYQYRTLSRSPSRICTMPWSHAASADVSCWTISWARCHAPARRRSTALARELLDN